MISLHDIERFFPLIIVLATRQEKTMDQIGFDDFIQQALISIISGVRKAQEGNQTDAIISPGQLVNNADRLGVNGKGLVQDVSFDVAVTVDKSTKTSGKIGVLFGILSLGSEGQSKAGETQVNRLKFSVPLLLPCGDEVNNR